MLRKKVVYPVFASKLKRAFTGLLLKAYMGVNQQP